jgi:hypothetical protein
MSHTPTALVSKKRPDTVGQPQSAESCASHMPSLRAQEHRGADTVTTVVLHGNGMTNSIRPFAARMMNGPILPKSHVQKLSLQISIQFLGVQKIQTAFWRHPYLPPMAPPCPWRVRRSQRAAVVRPHGPQRDLRWCRTGAVGWGRGEPLGWLQGEDRGTGGCRGGHDLLAASGRGGAGTDGMNWRFLVTRLLVGRCPLRSMQYGGRPDRGG